MEAEKLSQNIKSKCPNIILKSIFHPIVIKYSNRPLKICVFHRLNWRKNLMSTMN